MRDTVIGWDLGGAHLKAARLSPAGLVAQVVQLPCPLWQGLEHLDACIGEALALLGPAPVHAVTMTGEMVDLFADRHEGVRRIAGRIRELLPGMECRFYAGRHGWVLADGVEARAADIASANWRASAELVARHSAAALLVDIGSTTTDVIPILAGRVVARGSSDAERLVSRELVYSGVVRTPVMALAPVACVEGVEVPLMAECFATAADVHRLTGELPAGADLHRTADGGPPTPEASARRLARRSVCGWTSHGTWPAGRKPRSRRRCRRSPGGRGFRPTRRSSGPGSGDSWQCGWPGRWRGRCANSRASSQASLA
jgi:probable H4MPT-linked C1 transfer pathway protein